MFEHHSIASRGYHSVRSLTVLVSQGFQSQCQFLLQLNKVHKNQLPFHIIISSTETLGIIEMQDLHCAHSLSN